MEADSSFKKYSVKKTICGIFLLVIVLSFITFPKERINAVNVPLLKDSRPYKAHIISKLRKKYNSRLYISRRERIYNNIINEAAEKYGVEAELIKAIIMAESSYNHRAISKRGAVGLMQLMPATADALGVEDIFDPAHNVNGGTKYIKMLLEKFNNNLELALAAYNAGSKKVRKYNGIPPFRATKIYVKKVYEYYRSYLLASQA
ncbi:MAG: lytic transglycosylase domain-containing protein [Desulfobacteraceae bacterium]